MLFQLLLFLFFSNDIFIINTFALSNNSTVNIDLYQCNTNKTIIDSTTVTNDTIFNSCNISCCIINNRNKTTYFNTCQVSVRSSTGVCLGRLCYSGDCEQFLLLANKTHHQKMVNETMIVSKIRPSFSSIPWSPFINLTQTKWTLWIHKLDLSTQNSILIIVLIVNISLTFLTMRTVIKSFNHARMIAEKKSYRYSLF